jgi:Acetyltransferase (GNAT) domain
LVRVLQARSELEALREIWKTWCTDPRADIDFVLTAADCNAGILNPYVVVVYRGGHPDCMLIGYLEQQRMDQRVGYATMWHSNVRVLSFVRRGFLGNQSNENCNLLVQHISEFLKQGGGDCAAFSDLRADSPLRTFLIKHPGILFRQHFFATQRHNTLQFARSFNEFLSSLSRKDRHELRRHERMLDRNFPNGVRIESVSREDEVEFLLEVVDQISKKTYQRALGTGFTNSPEIQEQYRVAARTGTLRACLLYIRERPCAFLIGRQYKFTFFAEYTGYDPEFAKYSPGIFILMRCIRKSFELASGTVQFDLGSGDHSYKHVVCNVGWEEGNAYLYAPTFRGFLLNFQMTAIGLINATLRKLTAHSGFLKKARKQWQRYASRNFTQEPQRVNFSAGLTNEQLRIREEI